MASLGHEHALEEIVYPDGLPGTSPAVSCMIVQLMTLSSDVDRDGLKFLLSTESHIQLVP